MTSKIKNHSVCNYLVYILSGKRNKTLVGACPKSNFFCEAPGDEYSKLIYFEIFRDGSSAARRKNILEKLTNAQRLTLIKVKNPELLNLIFTVYDIH